MQEPCWLEEFKDTCQDIMEDTFLLDAVSKYMANDHYFMPGDQLDCALLVYCRLCDYLSQHVTELHRLEKRFRLDLTMKSGP